MRVLVTGSAGFIGRSLVRALEARGEAVTGIDSADGIDCRTFFALDLAAYDVVIHTAALTGGIEGTTYNAARQSAVNAQIDGAFFEWVLRTNPRRAVYFSSSCAYPLLSQTAMDHQRTLREIDVDPSNGHADGTPYGAVKLLGEVIAGAVRREVPVSIVRPFAVYGSDQEDCRMIPAFIDRVRSNDPAFIVWGEGNQASDFIHVDDVVGAVLAMIDQDIDGPVNLCTGRGASVDEVARIVLDAAGVRRPIFHDTDKPSGPLWRVGDPTLLRTFYEPKVSLEEGIRRALDERP